MLGELLAEIRSSGSLEVHLLAKRLHTSPEMVRTLLEHLEREGYLRPYLGCANSCQGCGLKEDCAVGKTGARLWQLSEKTR